MTDKPIIVGVSNGTLDEIEELRTESFVRLENVRLSYPEMVKRPETPCVSGTISGTATMNIRYNGTGQVEGDPYKVIAKNFRDAARFIERANRKGRAKSGWWNFWYNRGHFARRPARQTTKWMRMKSWRM